MQVDGIWTRLRVLLFVATLVALTTTGFTQQKNQPALNAGVKPSINPVEVPLAFEPNQGQTDGRVRFLSRGSGYSLFLTQDEAVLSVSRAQKSDADPSANHAPANATIRLKLDGANPTPSIASEGLLQARNNYYYGNDPAKWRTGVPTFARVRYQSVYPGIDMVYYGNQRRLEHDFVVAPGADPKRIRLAVDGAVTRIDSNGNLVLGIVGGEVRMLKPVVYQQWNGQRHEVQGSYKLLADNRVGFELGKYNKHYQLVIDPVLAYSTYYGGTGTDIGYAVATSSTGIVYFAGTTSSLDFPLVSATQTICSACSQSQNDAFIVAINPASGVIFSTYLGGSGYEEARGIAVSNTNNIYVAGFTGSTNFPTVSGGLPTVNHGGTYDGFVTQLNTSGSVVSSGYLGGQGEDRILGLAYDNANNHLLLTGYSTSSDFPYNPVGAGSIAPLPSQLYRTPDGAGSWGSAGGSLPNAIEGVDIQAFLITPNSSDYYAGGTSGVWHSTDGSTWAPFNSGLAGKKVTCLAYVPSTPAQPYACADQTLYQYNPTATQWIPANNGLPSQVTAVIADPFDPNLRYAGTAGNGVYRTTNGGGSWSQFNTGITTSRLFVNSLVTDSDGTLYVGLATTGTNEPLFYVLSGGTWVNPGNNGLPIGKGIYGNSLAADFRNGRIYAGIEDNGVWFTNDGGANWTQTGTEFVNGPSANVSQIGLDAIDQTVIYAGTDNGLYKSVDSGSSWFRSDSGIVPSTYRTLAVDKNSSLANGATIMFAGLLTQQGFAVSLDNSYSYILSTMFGGNGPAVVSSVLTNLYSPVFTASTSGKAIASDPSGNIYVAGNTSSTAAFIPGLPGAQSTPGGDHDAVLMKFAANGTIAWGTYLGGSGYESANGVAADANSVYVGGVTLSGTDFPVTAGVFQSACSAGCGYGEGFVARYNPSGAKQWATYIGGSGRDSVLSVAVDGSGEPVIAGQSENTYFPQANPLGAYPGPFIQNPFVSILNTNGTSLVFSSLFGGSNSFLGFFGGGAVNGVAVFGGTSLWLTGYTFNSDFPVVAGAPHSTFAAGNDAFLTGITTTGTSRDVQIAVTPTTPAPAAGSPVTFNITVTNASSAGSAANVKLFTDLALTAITPSSGSCTLTPTVSCTFGTMTPNSSVTATATYAYPSPGIYQNSFSVHTDDDDPNPANNVQAINANVTTGATDMAITITAPATVGRTIPFNYNVTLTNNGPADASNFTYVVNFDPNLQPISVTLPPGCSISVSTATCTVASLSAHQSANFTLQAIGNFSTPSVNTSATVSLAGDPNSGNNTSSAATVITNASDIAIFSSGNTSPVLGAPVAINLNYFTNGPDTANNVTLTIPLPTGVTFNSATGLTCSGVGTITCNVGQLAPDANPSATIFVTVNLPGTFTVAGTLQATEGDPDPSNNTFYASLTALANSGASEQYVVSDVASGTVNLYQAGRANPGSANTMNAGSATGVVAIDASGRYGFVNSSGFTAYTSVIDFTIGKEVARIHGALGRPMALTPDGSQLILHGGSIAPGTSVDHIAVVDTSTFQITKTISLDGVLGDQVGIADISISSGVVANNKLYLQVSYSPTTGNPVYTTLVVNLATNSVAQVTGSTGVGNTNIPSQRNIASSADGSKVYALRNTPAEMLVINTSTDTVTQSLPLAPITTIRGFAVSRDPNDPAGQFAYLVGRESSPVKNVIKVVDLKTLTLLPAETTLSFIPTHVVLSADGTYLHVFQGGLRTGETNAAYSETFHLRDGSEGIQEYTINNDITSVSMGFIVDFRIDFSPQVAAFFPSTITDTSAPTTVSIFGANFTSGAKVKFGNLDPLPTTFVSTGRLDFTLPAGVPEQDADVIVTLPNSQELPTGRNVSGVSFTRFTVSTPFQLNDPLLLLSYGQSTVSVVQKNKNGSGAGTIPNPIALQVTSDGKTAYVSNNMQTPDGNGNAISYIQEISLSTLSETARIQVLNDVPGYEDGFAISTDPVDGKPVLYYLAVDDINATTPSDQLYIIDLDPNSGTYRQVKRTIRSPFNDYAQSVTTVATSDGRYVYVTYTTSSTGTTRLEQFDTLNGTVTGVSNLESSFNVEFFPNHMRLTPDNNRILLPGADGSIKVFDVTSRSLTGLTAVTISDSGKIFKNFQVVGNRLFAFDAINNVVAAFNFLPAQPDFSKLGQVVLSGPASAYESPMRVDPTGSYVYISLKDQDKLAVLDANKVAASDSSAVLASGKSEPGLYDIQIAPSVPQTQVDLSLQMFAAPTLAQGATYTVSSTITNNSQVMANGVVATYTVPNGIDISQATFAFSSPPYTVGNCTVALPTVTCNLGAIDQTVSVILQTAPTQSSGVFTFLGTVSSIETDTNPIDNSASASTTVSPGSDVFVTANFPTGGVQAGQPLSFTFTVDNAGPAIATGLQGSMFGGLNNMKLNGVTCPIASVCSFNIGNLSPNSPQTFTLSGTVPAQLSPLSFEAVLITTSPDPNTLNNSLNSAPITITSAGAVTPTFLVANTAVGGISAFDPTTYSPRTDISAGVFPRQVLVMPNGRTAFLMNNDAAYISVVDLGIRKEIARIRGIVPAGGALTSDGTQLIVSDRITNNLVVLDTTSFTEIRRVPAPDVAFNLLPAGTKVFVTFQSAMLMDVLDLTTGALNNITGAQLFSRAPGHLALTPDGATVIAVGGGDTTVPAALLRIDVASRTLLQTLTLPTNTTNLSLAVTPTVGTSVNAYVSMDNILRAVDVKAGSGTLGQFVAGINRDISMAATSSAISPNGNTLMFVKQGTGLNVNQVFLDVPSITDATVITRTVSGSLASVTAAQIDFLPSSTAPQVTAISPQGLLNDTPSTIEVDGKNFSGDAVVRIGSGDPITPVFVDTTKLMVPLPPFSPSGNLDVTVINRNQSSGLNSRNEAGTLQDSSLNVVDGLAYNGQWNLFVANFGDSTYTTTSFTTASTSQAGVGNPWGIAASQNGIFFLTSQSDNNLGSFLGSEGSLTPVPLSGQVGYGDAIAIVPDVQTGRTVALAPSAVTVGANLDWQLNVVDADPFSPTNNLVIRSIPANSGGAISNPNGFAASPDGKFAYGFFNATDTTGRLAVYNLTNNSATVLTAASLGVDNFVQDMQVSKDGKYLAIANAFTNTIKVFDVTNPTSPVSKGVITPTVPAGTSPSCCNMRFTATQLFVFDPGTMLLEVFNFQPTVPNFGLVGSIPVPGSPDPVFQGGLALSPDGGYAYVAQYGDDSIAVFDANKVAASDSTALITRIQTGRAPVSIAVNPVPAFSTTADLSVTMNHTPDPVVQGTDVTFNVTVSNAGPFASGQVVFQDTLPTGMTLTSVSTPPQVSCMGIGTGAAQCSVGSETMDPGTSFNFSLTANTTNANGALQNVGVVTSVRSSVPDPNSANNTFVDQITVGQPDIAVTITSDVTLTGVNGTVNYTATVKNNGSVGATGVRATLSLDRGANFTSSPDCGIDGPAFCNIGTLDPGQTVTLHAVGQMPSTPGPVVATASVTENETDANPNDNNVLGQPVNVMLPDIAISMVANVPVTGVHALVTYTATITNNSQVSATGVTANLSLDGGSFFISSPDPQCSVDSNVFCNVGTLNAGQSVTVHGVGQMPSSPGTVTATGFASENETDANPTDNTATLALNVVNPDLKMTITANPQTPVINNLVTYTVVIANNSPAAATEAFARISIDQGNIVSSPECNLDGPAFCNFSAIGPNQSATVHVVAQMPNTAGTVTVTGTVSEMETDANPTDNTTTLALTVGGGADLSLSAASAPVIIGGVPTYTVTVTNNGPDVAPSTVVTDELTRFQFVSAVSSVGACSYDGIRIACPIGDLANGASATVSVSVVPPNSGWALSEFHATSNTIDPNGNNNIANLGPSGGTVGNTRAGVNVLVDALDAASGVPASFMFASVTRPGLTSVQSNPASQPPAGYRFGQPARVYDLSTTASYAGAIQVTLQFGSTVFHHPNKVRLFHLENGVWVDRTSGLDSVRGLVSGVTTSLSPFILAEPVNNVPVANAGTDAVTPAASVNGSQVTVNGAASTDADGDALSYRWTGPFPEGNGSVTGATPTLTLPLGSSKLTLVVNDGEADSAPVSMNVTVSDFLLVGPASQVALKRGQSATFDVAVSPKFGAFDASVALACGSLPSGVTCSISSPTVTPGGQGATATVTLTASTSAGLKTNSAPVFAFWLGGLPVFGLFLTGSLRPKNWRGWLLLGILLVVIAGMAACGGGGGSMASTPPPSANPGTTTTSIAVTGTAGGLQHATTTTVVIQ